MPLLYADIGVQYYIERITASAEILKRLEAMGFLRNTPVKVVSINNFGVIIEIKGSRVAMDKKMAREIIVNQKVCTIKYEKSKEM